MAKNQSRKPGRDVRGGKGKAEAPRQQRMAKQRGGAPQRDRSAGGERKGGPRKRPQAVPGGSGSWIEGRRAVAEALEVGMPLRRALVCDTDGSLAGLLRELEEAGVPLERVPRSRLDAISSHGAHQGIACQTAPFAYAQLEDVLARAGEGEALVLVLDHVTDQGNLGAIVRSAEVVGAAGVIIPKARAAGVGVGAYKTSAGAVLHLPIVQVSNLAATLETLKEHGFWVGASTEHAYDSVWEAPLEGRLCLVMGSEGSGISRLVLERCDFACRLPQRGRVESLNVAQAATVMCYEWLRRAMAAEVGGMVAPGEEAAQGDLVVPSDAPVEASGRTGADVSYAVDAAASYDLDWDL